MVKRIVNAVKCTNSNFLELWLQERVEGYSMRNPMMMVSSNSPMFWNTSVKLNVIKHL